jgi:hypothetical protein
MIELHHLIILKVNQQVILREITQFKRHFIQ